MGARADQIASTHEHISVYVAKRKRNARRKNAPLAIEPTDQRLAKGDLHLAPVYSASGLVAGYRYEERQAAKPLDDYTPLMSKRLQEAFVIFARGEALRNTAGYRNITCSLEEQNGFAYLPGKKLGGLRHYDDEERREYLRHEWVLRQLRSLDDAVGDRTSVEATLCAVVGYVNDGAAGRSVKLADIGRKLWNFRDEEAAKGVAVGAILIAGKFLVRCYAWFDIHYKPEVPSQIRQLGPPFMLR